MQKPKKLETKLKNEQGEQQIGNKNNQIDSESDQDQHLAPDEAYISDPHDYLKLCLKDKKIKVMDQCNPIMNNVYLKDISLHKKGPLEDKIYSKNDLYYCNIRRGNTLCQIYNQNQQESSLFMCRRGMKKFYDLEPQYMKVNRKLTHQHQRYRRRIFEGLDKILDSGNQGYTIHLYGLFKQNGEHCQISYVTQLGYWLFASKNVAILAKNEDQLKNHYEKQRFYWAKLIGHEFFKILATFSEEKKQQFMRDINGKTLLGEHCGNQQHQHITKYDKIEIIFYGLVENNGKDHCLPVQQCQNFLNKYGLKMSKMQKVQGLKQKNKVYFNMFKMLKKIAEGTMDQCGQGSVLYIVAEDNQGNQRTVGMCKLKTCEYLIYRRMRQMIKIYFSKKGATANSFEKYKFQVENLCEHYFKPPKPLDYYFQIAELAFEEVKKNGEQFSDDQFRYKFVNFLEAVEAKALSKKQEKQDERGEIRRIIFVCPPLLKQETEKIQKICKKLSISIEYGYRQDAGKKLQKSILHILHLVPRLNLDEVEENTIILTYQIEENQTNKIVDELTQNSDIKKSHLISFIKSEDKTRSLQLLNQKISAFGHSCNEKNKDRNKERIVNLKRAHVIQQVLEAIANKTIKNSSQIKMEKKDVEKKNQQMQQQEYAKKCNITVVMTMLIPGSGKSTLAETLTSNVEQGIEIISSDKIRQAIMQKYKGKRKGDQIQNQQAYAATKKKGLQKYREAVKQAIGEQPPSENKILYIDRLFCPTTIFENIEQISKPWTKFILLTQTQKQVRLNEYIYPRSLGYLLGCIKRCLEREQHQTLSTKPSEIVRVIFKFYQMYRGFTYNKLIKQLQEANIECQILQLDFFKQKDEPDNLFLKKKVEQCLKGISPGNDAPQSPLYTQLIELIYKYSDHIERKKTQQTEAEKEQTLKLNAQKLMKACKMIL